ncbi:MAG TPA: hypothetical protein VMN37_09805 [Gemmatimonadales bacterium]|nr:hypothetical protein [Gemmatimonadales bacterium]
MTQKNGMLSAALVCVVGMSLAGCDQMLPLRRQVAVAPPAADTAPSPAPVPRRRPPAAEAAPTGIGEDEAFNLIRRGLRRLVAAEQGFYAENGAYTEDFERLGFRPEGETQIRFLWLTRDGWAASGSHPALPGRDCVIFVGRVNAAPTSLKYIRSGREGVAACDVAPTRPQRSNAPVPAVSRAADTASALAAVSPSVQMRVDLRNLVGSQDAYLATQGTYARRLEPLSLQYLWQRGVRVAILSADAHSWSARASHVRQPGKSCVIWYGPVQFRPVTDAQQRSPDRSGVPVCDD